MKRTQVLILLYFILVLIPGCSTADDENQVLDIPYYFIAIHNEPCHVPNGTKRIEAAFPILQQMVAAATEYNIKLTLMFSPQWAQYINSDPRRLAILQTWKEQNHQIAAHHHSIYHGNWDGYSNYSQDEALNKRVELGKIPEPYLGTLKTFISILKIINPWIHCGCCNDEHDKNALPDEIVYDTCSGFANFGPVGTRIKDGDDPEKGKNLYITTGYFKNILRKWLAHYQITTFERQNRARIIFDSMDNSGVYGAVTHSEANQALAFYEYLDFLNDRDPKGIMSRTVSEVINQGLLPEKVLPHELIDQIPESQ